MKRLTVLFLALSLVLSGVMLWQWTHPELSVAARSVRTVPVQEMKSNYEAVRRAVTNGSLQGVVYHAEALREAEGPYSLESVAAAWERLLHSWECEPRDTPELLRYDAIRAQNWLRRGVKKVRELGWQTPAYLWDRLHNRL